MAVPELRQADGQHERLLRASRQFLLLPLHLPLVLGWSLGSDEQGLREETAMGNLGTYQAMTTIAKKIGGPKVLAVATAVLGYAVLRPAEAGVKKGIRAIKERSAPCATKGLLFRATSDGFDRGLNLNIRVGDEYRVLECDGEAILIEVLGDPGSPYFVSSTFLRLVSDFPQDDADGNE